MSKGYGHDGEPRCYRHRIETGKLELVQPVVVKSLQKLLIGYPNWEIVVVLGDFGGLVIRDEEIIDGLRRENLPKEFQTVDASAWDGSDLFIVWPLPGYRFASSRLANILRQEKISGAELIPAIKIPVERGAKVAPASITYCMPEDRARELGRRFGIS